MVATPGFDQPSAKTAAGTAIRLAETIPAQFHAMMKPVKRGELSRGGARAISKAGMARIARSSAAARPAAEEPRYVNPADPGQTWSGRGRRPRWVTEQIGAGKSLEDLLA